VLMRGVLRDFAPCIVPRQTPNLIQRSDAHSGKDVERWFVSGREVAVLRGSALAVLAAPTPAGAAPPTVRDGHADASEVLSPR